MKSTKSRKLSFGTETVRVLTADQMGGAHGGFTYSLSTGDRCQKSAMFTDGGTCRCQDQA